MENSYIALEIDGDHCIKRDINPKLNSTAVANKIFDINEQTVHTIVNSEKSNENDEQDVSNESRTNNAGNTSDDIELISITNDNITTANRNIMNTSKSTSDKSPTENDQNDGYINSNSGTDENQNNNDVINSYSNDYNYHSGFESMDHRNDANGNELQLQNSNDTAIYNEHSNTTNAEILVLANAEADKENQPENNSMQRFIQNSTLLGNKKYFSFLSQPSSNVNVIEVQCISCKQTKRGYANTTSNLLRHLKRVSKCSTNSEYWLLT